MSINQQENRSILTQYVEDTLYLVDASIIFKGDLVINRRTFSLSLHDIVGYIAKLINANNNLRETDKRYIFVKYFNEFRCNMQQHLMNMILKP